MTKTTEQPTGAPADLLNTADPLPRDTGAWSGAEAMSIDPAQLDADPVNVRRDLGDVTDLAASLRENGMLQPILAVPGDEGRFTIVSGHRRATAALEAGMTAVPVLVRPDLADSARGHLVAQLVENLQRHDLTAVEEARAYQRLTDLGLKQTEIAKRVGVNQGTISKRLGLLKLDEVTLAKVETGAIPVADAGTLAKLPPERRRQATDALERAGQKPDAELRRFEAEKVRQKARQKIADDLEAAGVALVDFPNWGQWGDREDQPLIIGGDHQAGVGYNRHRDRQPEVATLDDHAGEPCHGAAVSEADEPIVVWVCLDPARHGCPTILELQQAADFADKERQAEVEAAKQAQQAAAAARIKAARKLMAKPPAQPAQTAYVLDAVLASIRDAAGPAFVTLEADAERLLPALGIDVPEDANWDELTRDLAAAVTADGPLKVAFVAALIAGDDDLGQYRPAGELGRAYLRLLEAEAGYNLSDTERAALDPPAPDPTVELPTAAAGEVLEVPDGAVAYYVPTTTAADDGDEARWVDQAEAEGIANAGQAHRLAWGIQLAAELDESTFGEPAPNQGTEPVLDEPGLLDADELAAREAADDAHAAAEAPQVVEDEPGEQTATVAPGEPCPGSGRPTPAGTGAGASATCPNCGDEVASTLRGKLRQHKAGPGIAGEAATA